MAGALGLQDGIPVAGARVDGRATPPVYLSNTGNFDENNLTRTSPGVYVLVLGFPVGPTEMKVEITGEHPEDPADGITKAGAASYRIINQTTIEVMILDKAGYGAYDARFSIDVARVI